MAYTRKKFEAYDKASKPAPAKKMVMGGKKMKADNRLEDKTDTPAKIKKVGYDNPEFDMSKTKKKAPTKMRGEVHKKKVVENKNPAPGKFLDETQTMVSDPRALALTTPTSTGFRMPGDSTNVPVAPGGFGSSNVITPRTAAIPSPVNPIVDSGITRDPSAWSPEGDLITPTQTNDGSGDSITTSVPSSNQPRYAVGSPRDLARGTVVPPVNTTGRDPY